MVNHPEFSELLKKFERLLRTTRPRSKTLLEIADVHHWELAHSNILAFFLDSRQEHGLADLFLTSLLEASGIDFSCVNMSRANVKVDREVRTRENKCIDLVVETDHFVIGIENKVFAKLDNPLTDYREWVKERAREGEKKPHGVLLGLKKETDKERLCNFFRSITYDELFSTIRKNLGPKAFTAEARGLTSLMDFVATIENLKHGTRMDRQLLDFLKENQKFAQQFSLWQFRSDFT